MNRLDLREDGPQQATRTLILAHGAGQGMDSPFMHTLAQRLCGCIRDLRVVRFEFPYMARRKKNGKMSPPDREPVLIACWRQAIETVSRRYPDTVLLIGGKSLGGRIASMIADEQQVRALICFGYPFHPPGKPDRLRTDHLLHMQADTLICQGTRDPFGQPDEVEGYALPPRVKIVWIPDGDHSFKPRKVSGRSLDDNLLAAAGAVSGFLEQLG